MSWAGWGRPLVVLGWTADGEHLVYTRQVEYYPLESIDDDSVEPWKLVFGVVREARTGREQAYLLELSDTSGAHIHRDELAQLPGLGAWRTWLAQHPLGMVRGPRSPRGVEARVDATVADDGPEPVRWQHDRYRLRLLEGRRARLDLGVVVDGRAWPSITMHEGSDGISGWAVPLWSPDGQRLAWWVEHDDGNPRGATQYVVIAALGPRVELVVSPDDEARAWNAIDRLEQAGVPPVFVSRGPGRTEGTVVRAAAGREDDARALAERLPRPVAIAELDGPSEFDLSVVAGPALMEPPASSRVRLPRAIAARDLHTLFGFGMAAAAALVAWLASYARPRRR